MQLKVQTPHKEVKSHKQGFKPTRYGLQALLILRAPPMLETRGKRGELVWLAKTNKQRNIRNKKTQTSRETL